MLRYSLKFNNGQVRMRVDKSGEYIKYDDYRTLRDTMLADLRQDPSWPQPVFSEDQYQGLITTGRVDIPYLEIISEEPDR